MWDDGLSVSARGGSDQKEGRTYSSVYSTDKTKVQTLVPQEQPRERSSRTQPRGGVETTEP